MTIEQIKEEAKRRFDRDLTDEEAQAYLDANPSGELREEDLERVTGGWGSTYGDVCPNCGSRALFKDAAPSADGATFYRCTMCRYVCTAEKLKAGKTARG